MSASISLLTLPPVVVLIIAKYLPIASKKHRFLLGRSCKHTSSLCNLSATCRALHRLLDPLIAAHLKRDANKVLFWAVGVENGETLIQRALANGADPNAYIDGYCPLLLAVSCTTTEPMRILLEAGAYTKVGTVHLPLKWARSMERNEMAELLKEYMRREQYAASARRGG